MHYDMIMGGQHDPVTQQMATTFEGLTLELQREVTFHPGVCTDASSSIASLAVALAGAGKPCLWSTGHGLVGMPYIQLDVNRIRAGRW